MLFGLSKEQLSSTFEKYVIENAEMWDAQEQAANAGESPIVADILPELNKTSVVTPKYIICICQALIDTMAYNNEILSKSISEFRK